MTKLAKIAAVGVVTAALSTVMAIGAGVASADPTAPPSGPGITPATATPSPSDDSNPWD
jgi:hypothetical protein